MTGKEIAIGDSTVFILDPRSRPGALGVKLAERPADIRGLTVGFLDNGRWSFSVVVNGYRHLPEECFGIRDVIYHKNRPSSPERGEVCEKLATRRQVILNGLCAQGMTRIHWLDKKYLSNPKNSGQSSSAGSQSET